MGRNEEKYQKHILFFIKKELKIFWPHSEGRRFHLFKGEDEAF